MAQSLLDELPPAQRLALAYAPEAARAATLSAAGARCAPGSHLAAAGRARAGADAPGLVARRAGQGQAEWPRGDAVLGLLCEWRDPAALIPLVDGWEICSPTRSTPLQSMNSPEGGRRLSGSWRVELGVLRLPPRPRGSGGLWEIWPQTCATAASGRRCSTRPRRCRPAHAAARAAPACGACRSGRRSLARGGTPLLEGFGAALLAMRVGIAGR